MYNIGHLYLKINKGNVKFYGYRQAHLKLRLVSFNRDDMEIKRLEERLWEITEKEKDNHVLFEVKIGECTFGLQFTDSNMWLGLGVEEQIW